MQTIEQQREILAEKALELRLRAKGYMAIADAVQACSHHQKPTRLILKALKKAHPELTASFDPGGGISSPIVYAWGDGILYKNRCQVFMSTMQNGVELNPFEEGFRNATRSVGQLVETAEALDNADLDSLRALSEQAEAIREKAEAIRGESAAYIIDKLFPAIWGQRY